MNRKVAPSVVLALASAALALPAAASADVTFHVNSTKDAPDQTDVDGKCLATNGKCTLRAAVTEANVQPGPDTIKLPNGTFKLTIPGATGVQQGDLDVLEAVNIQGKSAAKTKIRQTVADRIFEIDGGLGETTVRGVTLTGGRAETFGGAIYASSPLDIERSRLVGNRVHSVDPTGAYGGAVDAYPSLTMNRDVVSGNTATSRQNTADGGGVQFLGFGAGNSLSMNRTVIRDNAVKIKGAGSDAVGGGLASSGVGEVQRSTIAGNRAVHAGGIFENGDQTLTVSHSLIADNRAADAGGALQASAMVVTDSTITGNRVTGKLGSGGGGIFRFAGTIVVLNSTVAGNRSTLGATDIESNDSSDHAGEVVVRGSIVGADASGIACSSLGSTPSIHSLGYNVGSDGSCHLSVTGDVNHKNPKLKPLAGNGGPTKTMALKKGSPALGRVASGCPPDDQRGKPRPGTGCDSGAYER